MAGKTTDTKEPTGEGEQFRYWKAELDAARKAKGYSEWLQRGKDIIHRYRDERSSVTTARSATDAPAEAKFNVLWSNIQTLQPAVYAKPPKPMVERRFLDRDPIARVASTVLQRTLSNQIEMSGFHENMRKSVLDRLLPGRGVLWLRYQATYQDMPEKTQETAEDKHEAEPAEPSQEENDDNEQDEPAQEVTSECVYSDYINWEDFLTNPARTWQEVRWVAKRVFMTRDELTDRFKEKGKEVTLDWKPQELTSETSLTGVEEEQFRKAKVWEIWNKVDRKVRWLAESYTDSLLDEVDDPLRLEDFFPCPCPLFATMTNETLIPVPDYYEYLDQAMELDQLTSRIHAVVKAIKVVGFYAGETKDSMSRILEEGFENRMVAVDNWAAFAEKGGTPGVVSFLPVKDLIEVVTQLYAAREQVKQSLYEITGISDIIRGAQTSGDKTATEQRIKGQFASMRLNAMQAEITRFARDTLCLMGEIISEHFSPMTLFLMSAYEQYAKEQFPPEPNPMMGHNGGPPMGGPPGPMAPPPGMPPPGPPQPMAGAPMMPPVDPAALARKKAADVFQAAVKLLKDDKLRGFRIDIETDSMIEADRQQTQASRTELLQAISQFLPEAITAGEQVPQLQPLMGKLLLFFLRGFSASRDIESAFEQAIDQMEQSSKNPPPKPPSPEQIKANAMMQQSQNDMALQREKLAGEQQKAQQAAQIKQQEMTLEMESRKQEFAIEQQRAQFEMSRLADERAYEERKHAMEMEKLALEGYTTRHDAVVGALERQHQHGLNMEVATVKAEQAKKPKV